MIGEEFAVQDLLAFGPIWLGITVYFYTRPKPVRVAVLT